MIDFKTISWFKDIIKVKEIRKGNLERKKYKIITEKQTYFVKVQKNTFSDKEITKIKYLYKIYQDNKIPIIPLIDILVIEEMMIWIFPFFNGKTLDNVHISLFQLKQYGKRIAKDVKVLNKIIPDSKLIKTTLYDNYYQRKVTQFKLLLDDKKQRRKLFKIFRESDWISLLDFLQKLYLNIKDDKVMLNHNDIHLNNIMIDRKNNYYFIDFYPNNLTFLGHNLVSSISCFLSPKHKKRELSFLCGFIQEIDPQKEVINQLNFFLILSFMSKINNNYIYFYINRNYYKKLLYNKDNFLTKLLYND